MPELTHGSVQQLIQVLERTAKHHRNGAPLPTAYRDSVRDVSRRHGVTYQTIGDLCRRRLALSDIGEFMDLLGKWLRGDADPLRHRIKRHSTRTAHAEVDHFFSTTVPSGSETSVTAPRTTSSQVEPTERPPALESLHLLVEADLADRLRLAQIAGIGSTLEETAIALLERGFDVEKTRVQQFLTRTVGAT